MKENNQTLLSLKFLFKLQSQLNRFLFKNYKIRLQMDILGKHFRPLPGSGEAVHSGNSALVKGQYRLQQQHTSHPVLTWLPGEGDALTDAA